MRYTAPQLHSFTSDAKHGNCVPGTVARSCNKGSEDYDLCDTGSGASGGCDSGNSPTWSCGQGNAAKLSCWTGNGVKGSCSCSG